MSLITHIGYIIFGVIGGFCVSYLSDILPRRKQLVKPICLACDTQLTWKNYFISLHPCQNRTHRAPIRRWIIPPVYGVIAFTLWQNSPEVLGRWLGLGILVFFGVVVIIDLEHRLILNNVSIVGAALGLITGTWLRANYFAQNGASNGTYILQISSEAWLKGLGAALLGGMIGFGIMWLLYFIGEQWMRVMAKLRGLPADEVALGFGDVNLSGVLGLMLGWPGIILGVFLAVLMGGIISLLYLAFSLVFRRYRLFAALPYGPNLIASGIILLFFSSWVSSVLK